jgi:hypothetical protein
MRLGPFSRFRERRATRLHDEIQFHRDRLVEDYIAAGLTRGEAERRAFLEFGGVPQIEEAVRDVRGRWLEDLAKDLRYAFRRSGGIPAFPSSLCCCWRSASARTSPSSASSMP